MKPGPQQFFIIVFGLMALHVFALLYHYSQRPEVYWSKGANRNISHYISSEIRELPKHFCKYPTTLLIMVHSVAKNEEARDAIRATWGNKTVLDRHNTSLFFLLGEDRTFSVVNTTKNENFRYQDLIVENFIDSYANLTLKSMSMLKLLNHGKNCKHLLKADEDLYVNVALLILSFKNRSHDTGLLMGRLIKDEKPKSNYRSKWYTSRYMYRYNKYPTFLGGPAYVMSRDVGEELYQVALKIPLFHLEDVFLTGICARKAGIRPQNNLLFTDYGIPKYKCKIYTLITAHSFSPSKLFSLQKLMVDLRKSCGNLANYDRDAANRSRIHSEVKKFKAVNVSKCMFKDC